MISLLLATAVLAQTVELEGSVVTATFDMPNTPPAQMFALIRDQETFARIVGGIEILGRQPQGACERIDYAIPHPITTLEYTLDLCPDDHETGFQVTLIEGPFKRYTASWAISPRGKGSGIDYRLDVVSSLFIPNFIVNRSSKKGIENMVDKLIAHDGSPL